MTIRTSIKVNLFSALLGALLVAGAAIAPAYAQRTWVSGVGSDSNPCSRTAPCATWAHALTQTPAGGEIDALDPGGFGVLTVNQSVTIDGGGGQVASTLVTGMPGITISAPGGTVILRNIRVNGLINNSGSQGTVGVNILSASRVVIEKCDVFGFNSTGILVAPNSAGTLFVKIQETTVNDNSGGISIKPSGGAVVNAQIERTHSDNNVNGGIRVDGTAGGSSTVSITDSSFSLNGANGLNVLSGSSGNVAVDVQRTVFGENAAIGISASNANGGTATVTVGDSMLSNNVSNAWAIAGTATLLSFKNNQVTGPSGSAPGTATLQ